MISFSPELIFLRMKIRPPAMSRNKEKIRVPPISPNGRSLQRYAKPKRKLRELRLSINGRRFKEPKPKINVAYNVSQLHAGRDFNYRNSCKKLHFKYLLSCQRSAETRLAGSLLLGTGIFYYFVSQLFIKNNNSTKSIQ